MQEEMETQLATPLHQHQAMISPLCLGCKFETLLTAKNIDLSDRADWEKLANRWGDQPVAWLHRCLTGEVSWIPHLPFLYLLELLDIAPDSRQESILLTLNKRSFFRRGNEPLACPRHSKL